MTWDGKSQQHLPIIPRIPAYSNNTATANEQLLLTILATHDIKVDFPAVAASFGPHCSPRAVQEQIKKLKIKAKTDGPTAPDAKTNGSGPASKKTTPKVKTDTKATNGVKHTSKKRKTNGGGVGLLSPMSEDGQNSDGGAVPEPKRDIGSSDANGTAKRILAAKRKAEEMSMTEEGDGDGVAVKAEGGYQHEDDLSDISAFDPADDQLTAEYEQSLGAI